MASEESKSKSAPSAMRQFSWLMIGVALMLGVGFFIIQSLDTQPNEQELTLTEFTSEALGFSIQHPEGWLATESDPELARVVSFDEQTDPNDTSDPYRSLPAQVLVDIQQASSPESEFEEAAFFELIETNIEASLGQDENSDPTTEYAELIAKEEITVDGYSALRVTVDIFNFENTPGENGHGVLTFIYVSPSKQVTLLYEGHSSDDAIYNQFHTIIESFDLVDNN